MSKQKNIATKSFSSDNPNSIRLRTLIKNKQHDIVHIGWLLRCVEEKSFLPFYLSDIISCTDRTRQALSLLYDEYGDAYFTSTNESELREIFSKMTSSTSNHSQSTFPANKKRRLNDSIPFSQSTINIDTLSNPLDTHDKLRSYISEFENVYFPDESSDYGLFRLFNIYFDQYYTIGDESTRFIDSNEQLIVLESQLHGARIAQTISPDVTHVVCTKSKSDQDRINTFKKINRDRTKKFHLVSYEWIEACIANERLLNELPFAL